MLRRLLLLLTAAVAAMEAQPPAKPVIAVRGVVNLFSQDPAPSLVAPGALVVISGFNLGPADTLTAPDTPWPTHLGDVQVAIDGKPAPLYSVSTDTIVAQVPPNASAGLVEVVVKRTTGASIPAHVTVSPIAPAVRTAKDAGFGPPRGAVSATKITIATDGLGNANPRIAPGDVASADTPARPAAALSAYVGGLRAKVDATASTTTPGQFDATITVPEGARPGDLITFIAARQMANQTVFQPIANPRVEYVPLPDTAPAITTLVSAGLNGNLVMALGARDTDGCYPAALVNLATKDFTVIPDCITSESTAVIPAVAPAQSDTIGALIGPKTMKIFSPAGDPLEVELPSPASVLSATASAFSATLPGPPAKIATIDPVTGDVQIAAAPSAATPGTTTAPAVDVDGLKSVFASTGLGQGRTAVLVGDDAFHPTKAKFAILNTTGDAAVTKDFPAGWLPLLTAVAPVRTGQITPPAPPRATSLLDATAKLFFVLARATDSAKDAYIAFALADDDPVITTFPTGWFATSCTSDIRLFTLNLVHQVALAGSRVAESDYKANCSASGFLLLDVEASTVTPVPLPDQGQLRVPTSKADTSLAMMSDYVYGIKLDTTRTGTADTLYVLDGAGGSAMSLEIPTTVDGFSFAGLQQVAGLNALMAPAIKKTVGDEGFVVFDLDAQKVTNLPVPDGFDSVTTLEDGVTACCMATRNLVARALKQGGGTAVVIYDLVARDLTVAPNPAGVNSIGPAATNASPRLVSANSRANTVYAVAYRGTKQVGIIIVRIP